MLLFAFGLTPPPVSSSAPPTPVQVVRVVLQEGMQAAQQLRVYVSALLAALQGRRALSSPVPVSGWCVVLPCQC